MKAKNLSVLLGLAFLMGSCSMGTYLEIPSSETAAAVDKRAAAQDVYGVQRDAYYNDKGPVVSRLADGLWIHQYGAGYYQPPAYAFWIDLKVQNLAYEKDIGVKWTNDGWQTVNDVKASYEGPLTSGFEQWGVDVYLPRGASTNIEYAVYGTMNGVTSWDPANNHFIGQLAGSKVKFVGGSVVLENGQASYKGLVRVENLGYEKVVNLIYTRDGWAHTLTGSASYVAGNDWAFSLPLELPDPCLLEFAVQYQVNGQTYYDNNSGQNYRFQIGPKPEIYTPTTGYLSGIEFLNGTDANINATTSLSVRVNGQSVAVANEKYFRFLLNTLDYAPAAQIDVTVDETDDKGFHAVRTFTFRTDKHIVPAGSFGQQRIVWPYNAKYKGNRIYFADNDYSKSQFHAYDTATGALSTFTAPLPSRDIDVLADGTMVLLADQNLYFFTPAGTLIKTITIPASQFNIPVALEIAGDVLYVASYVEHKVIKLDTNGLNLGEIPLNYFHKIKIIEGRLWVLVNYPEFRLNVLNLDGTLAESHDLSPASGRFGYDELDYLEDFAVSASKIALLTRNKVTLMDRTFDFRYKWTGYTLVDGTDVDGGFGSVVSSLEIVGDRVYVGDFGNQKVHVMQLLD